MATLMQQFVSGLKSRNEETRAKAARDLNHYVTTELREVSVDDLTVFMDDFNHYIFEMVSSPDANEKKGGILAIVSLIGVDVGNTSTRNSRFANYLRNLLPSNDTVVMEMAGKAVGRLALASGTYTAEYVEFEAKRAFEWLSADRNEGRRHAAVLILRELAVCTPTFFFQQVQQFFDCIFNAVRDPKSTIREGAVAALRSALVVTSQREIKEKEKPLWYRQCFDEAEKLFDDIQAREKRMSRDDWAHGSLLIINELLRCSNIEGERVRQEMEEISQQQQQHERTYRDIHSLKGKHHAVGSLQQIQQKSSPLGSMGGPRNVQKANFFESRTCKHLMNEKFNRICQVVLRHRQSRNPLIQQTLLSVLPRLAAFQPKTFVTNYLDETLLYLLGSLRKDRERSAAFQAIGLLAVSVQQDINRHLPKIMEVIRAALPSKDMPQKKSENFRPNCFHLCQHAG